MTRNVSKEVTSLIGYRVEKYLMRDIDDFIYSQVIIPVRSEIDEHRFEKDTGLGMKHRIKALVMYDVNNYIQLMCPDFKRVSVIKSSAVLGEMFEPMARVIFLEVYNSVP